MNTISLIIAILAGSTLSLPRTPEIFLPISSSRVNNSRNSRTAKFIVEVDLACKAMSSSRDIGKFRSSGKVCSVILAISSRMRWLAVIPGSGFERTKDGSGARVLSRLPISVLATPWFFNVVSFELVFDWLSIVEALVWTAIAMVLD